MSRTASQISLTVEGDVGELDQLDLTSSNPLTVALVDTNGDQITSLGGSQFDDGDSIDTTSQGTLMVGTTGVNGTARAIRTNNAGLLLTRSSVIISGIEATSILAGTKVEVSKALPAGTNNIGDVDIASFAVGSSVNLAGSEIQGTNADDSAILSNPILSGGTAKDFDGTAPGNVSAENDVAIFITDRNRRLYVNDVHPQMWTFHTDKVAGNLAITDKEIAAAPGANTSVFVTDITFSSSSVAAGLKLFFEEGSTKVLGPYYLEEGIKGRGATIQFRTPKKITENTALTLSTLLETGTAIEYSIDVQGFVARIN